MGCKSISTTPSPSPAEDPGEASKAASTERLNRKKRGNRPDNIFSTPVAISAPPAIPCGVSEAKAAVGNGPAGEPVKQPVTSDPPGVIQTEPAGSRGQESALGPSADARMALLRTPGEAQKTPVEGQKLPGPGNGETELPGSRSSESPPDKIYKNTDSTVSQTQDGPGKSPQNGLKSSENGAASSLEAGGGKASQAVGGIPEKQVLNLDGMVDATGQLAVNRKMTMDQFARQFDQELPSEDLKGRDALPVRPSKRHDLSGAEERNALTPIGVDVMGLRTTSLGSVPTAAMQEAARGAGAVEKIEHAIAVHAMELQRLNATTLHAVIQSAPGAELHLRVHWNGQNVEAQLRGSPGSEEFLKSHWGQLQESLGAKGIVLAPVETKPGATLPQDEGRDTSAGRQDNPQEFQRREPAAMEEKQNHLRQGSRETKTNHRSENQAGGKTTRMLESWA